MLSKEIRELIRENRKHISMFESYDETREFDLDRVRRSFTIRKSTYGKLKSLAAREGVPMSRLLDRLVERASSC